MHPLAWLINGTKLNFHLSLMQFIWLKKHPKTLIITVQRAQLWVKGSAEQRQVLPCPSFLPFVILLFREEILHQKHTLFDSWEHRLQIIDQHIQV